VGEAGRDPAKMGVAYRVKRHAIPMPPASDGNRRLFSGTIAQTIEDIRALRGIGVTGLDFDFEQDDADGVIAGMRRFRDEIAGRV
jgi:hypothetical protein